MKDKSNTILAETEPPIHPVNRDQIFKHLLEILPGAVYTCDKEGRITFYNEHAAKMWGKRPELGKDLWCGSWKLYTPEGMLLPPEECPIAIVLKTGLEIEKQEIIIERPDGTRLNVVEEPKPLHDENGELVGAMNLSLDITRQKKDEEMAARLTSIIQSSSAAIISKTLNGIVTSWNPAAQQIFGYTSEEMIGQPIIKLIPHDLYHEEELILEKLRKGERIEHMETIRITKEGKVIDVSLTVSPVRDDKGRIIGVSKIARDVSHLKRAERLIRESEERFRMAVSATKLGTWEYDPLTQDLMWSNECRKIHGVDDDERVEYSTFLKFIHPDDYDFVSNEIERAMEPSGAGNYDIRFRIIKRNGAVRWIRSQGKVYFNQQRLAERFIGTVLDITDEKNAREELERQVSERTRELKMMNKQLQRSNSDLAQFASVASHDLQEPLRKVQMYCDRILAFPDDSEVYNKFFPRIMAASARMSQLIKDVLHYAQISDGTEEFYQVDLNIVFDNVVSDLEVAIKEKHAEVASDQLPVIKGNSIQLHQLFANLIGNAIKFNRQKPIVRVSSRIMKKTEAIAKFKNLYEANSYVELRFSDNGIGFEQKYASQVFEIFQRLQDRNEYGGTGIGLAVCKKIVENHHGLISVDSESGAGSTFTIILPAN